MWLTTNVSFFFHPKFTSFELIYYVLIQFRFTWRLLVMIFFRSSSIAWEWMSYDNCVQSFMVGKLFLHLARNILHVWLYFIISSILRIIRFVICIKPFLLLNGTFTKKCYCCFHAFQQFDNLQLILNHLFSWYLMLFMLYITLKQLNSFEKHKISLFTYLWKNIIFRKKLWCHTSEKCIIDFNNWKERWLIFLNIFINHDFSN